MTTDVTAAAVTPVAADAAAASAAATTTTTDTSTTGDAGAVAPAAPAADAPKTEGADAGKQPDAGEKADTAENKAPEEYKEFTAPEGVKFDDVVLSDLKTVAKELNLSQEAAQKIVDLGAKLAQRQAEAASALRSEWVEKTKADKEIGGDALDENRAVAVRALEAFGTPELNKLLQDTGLHEHPEMIRAFYRAGKAISDDKLVTSGSGVPVPKKSAADILFPKTKS
jgi:hypothetical protein